MATKLMSVTAAMALAIAVVVSCTAFASDPRPVALIDTCELIELNHRYDDEGRLIFSQLIFYDWARADNRLQVRDWRFKAPSAAEYQHKPAHAPVRRGDAYVSTWHDGTALRQVRAKAFIETWTQYDPECEARQVLPIEQRRKLSEPWRPSSWSK